jgi:hypothetical protein
MPIIYIKIEILAGSLTSWMGFLILIFSIEEISVVDPDPKLSSPDPTPLRPFVIEILLTKCILTILEK